MFIEALADAAVKCGMPRQQAYIYAAQTVKGSADVVLQTSRHPAELKDAVCSPGGTTIDGVAALENNNFRNAVIQAVEAAYKKSINLGK
jgi:pyrroline-5-carboxylate reductase